MTWRWGRRRKEKEADDDNDADDDDDDWWIVKATGANGGMDVHVVNHQIQDHVLQKLQAQELYVIQRYILHPMLYHGRKFHFRAYALLRGDGLQPYLYRQAYILAASHAYSLQDDDGRDDLMHLTNLSVNKVRPEYPGEIPVSLPEEYPEAWIKMKQVWAETVKAAAPFMAIQVGREREGDPKDDPHCVPHLLPSLCLFFNSLAFSS